MFLLWILWMKALEIVERYYEIAKSRIGNLNVLWWFIMAKNYGKEFEQKFKEDFLKLGDCCADRLYDALIGYKFFN